MNTSKPAVVVKACVRDAICQNYVDNDSDSPRLVTITVDDVVERYGLDDGTYVHGGEEGRLMSAAHQLVRNEMLAMFRQSEILRLRNVDGSPVKRDRQYVYVAEGVHLWPEKLQGLSWERA